MTLLGKIFLLVNLALSLLLATVAFSTYTSGIDWSNNPAKDQNPEGKLVPVKKEIDELTKQLALTVLTWKSSRTELATREEQIRQNRQWYTQELRDLYESKTSVKMVGPSRPGEPMDNRPTMINAEEAPGVPLQPMPYYISKLQELRNENERIRKELEAKIKEDTALTNQLTGDPETKQKGLRDVLVEERLKRLGIVSEEGIVEGMRINALVELEIILQRLETINARMRELQLYLKSKHGVDVPVASR